MILARLSIFWRSALGYLTVIALVVGVNLYMLNQLRVLTELGAELVTHHFPAVETAKRLISSLYTQLKSDKQYLVLRDTALFSKLQHQIDYTASKEIVSTDLVGSRAASVVDSQATIAADNRLTLYVWYDNEFGYSCQVLRVVRDMAGLSFPTLPL